MKETLERVKNHKIEATAGLLAVGSILTLAGQEMQRNINPIPQPLGLSVAPRFESGINKGDQAITLHTKAEDVVVRLDAEGELSVHDATTSADPIEGPMLDPLEDIMPVAEGE